MNSTLALNPDTGKLVWYYLGASSLSWAWVRRRIEHFAGRTAMNIEGLGEAIVDQLVEEYFPIREADGSVPGVFEIYRDATPILATVAATTREVILVVLVASVLLGLILYFIFQAAQRRLTRQTRALIAAGRSDALTGLLNHGTTVAALADLLEKTRGSDGCTGVALIDIDNFRLVNDTHGHQAGDRALLEVARIMRTEFAETSILGRYGPDEFQELVQDRRRAARRARAVMERLFYG